MTLNELAVGASCKVIALHGEGLLKRRLMDMGVTPGTEIFLRKKAPLGDPLELTLRGYELSMRKGDAELVEIELTEEAPEGGKLSWLIK